MLQLLQPGQFNQHITDKNALVSPKVNDLYHQPYVLKLKNKAIQLDQNYYGKEGLTDSYLSQPDERSLNQLLKMKSYELENLSLKQQNEFLSREIGQQRKEINILLKFCQNSHLPPVIKPKQFTFIDQETSEYLPSSNGLYQQNGFDSKRAYTYDYQSQPRNDNYSDSNTYHHPNRSNRQSRIQSRNSREFQKHYEDSSLIQQTNFRIKHISREFQASSKKKKKFHITVSRIKVLFLFILAYIRWSRNYRQKRIIKIQQLKQIRQKYAKSLETISSQDVHVNKAIIKQWISNIIDPFIKSCSSNQFILQSNESSKNPNSESSIQCRQNQLIQLTNQILSNMEKFTEKDKIPQIIQASLFLSLFKNQNTKAPLYIAKRTKYYTKNTIKIGIYQEKMITGEYFIFRLFISNLIESSNTMVFQNINHKMQCKFIILAIIGILQILYQDYFSELKQFDNPSTELFQRRIKISKSQDISIITDDNIDYEESLIYGLHGRQSFQNIMENNQEWLQEICTKFAKILNNLHSIL